MHSSLEQPRVPPEPLPISSQNSGVSGSDGGAADSVGSDFVVAGSPVQGLEHGHVSVQGCTARGRSFP